MALICKGGMGSPLALLGVGRHDADFVVTLPALGDSSILGVTAGYGGTL